MIVFLLLQVLRLLAKDQLFSQFWTDYILAEYFPPYLPFVLLTMAFACMVIPVCMYIGEKQAKSPVVLALQQTGQMTLTHYVMHLTLGMILMAALTGKHYTGFLEDEPLHLPIISLVTPCFFIYSVFCSAFYGEKNSGTVRWKC